MPSALAVLGISEDTGRDRELGVGEPMALAASKNTEGPFDQGFQTLFAALRQELVSGPSLGCGTATCFDLSAQVILAIYRCRFAFVSEIVLVSSCAKRWTLSEALVESWL